MSGRTEDLRREYRGRINRVMDYIEENLSEPLTLEELASVAHFSKYHFHRVFFAETGETLFQFIQRVRLEKAAVLLCSQPKRNITDIALDAGFSGSASFAKAFRAAYGVSAGAFRNGAYRNFGKTDGNTGQAPDKKSGYIDGTTGRKQRRIEPEGTEVRTLEPITLAYVRHTGPFQGDAGLFENLYRKLYRWAGPRGLLENPDRREIVVYHDSPGLTDDMKLRISAGITVPPGTEVEGEVGLMTLPGGKYVLARFRPAVSEYGLAWLWVFGEWMPGSGWQPADGASFEMYNPDEKADEEGRCNVDICVPVEPV